MVNIFEDRYEGLWKNQDNFIKRREDLMEEEQIQRVDFYLGKYIEQRSAMGEDISEWEDIDSMCAGNRESNDSGEETSFINEMTPNIEGQVASMTNYNISARLKGRGVGDQMLVKTAEPIVDFILHHNKIRNLVKECGRRYVKLGNAFVTVGWNPDAYDGMGAPEIKARMLTEILPDKKIRNPIELDRSDYIIEEAGQFSVLWAEREYGEDIARAIQLGNANEDFQEQYEMDDASSFTMLRVWTKMNEEGNLQLLLMSACGILLEESDPSEPYYTRVFNQYPVFYAGLYPQEGKFYRFGDGRLLKPIQELINKLYDEVLLAVKFATQGRTYIDPSARVKPSEFAECDPSKPIIAQNPHQNILTARGSGINEGIYSILGQLFAKVQEVTRFSTLMTGQSGATRTATEAGILMQQGATGVDDKKGDISTMLSDAVLYAFALCLEHWSSGVALRVSDDEDDFVWVDPDQLTSVPKMIPSTTDYQNKWRKSNPKKNMKEVPKWMQLEVDEEEDDIEADPLQMEDGTTTPAKKSVKKPATNQIALDISVSIGEGMPTNKVSMYNILLSLSQLQVLDEQTMTPVPLLTRKKVTDMLEDILGITIEEDERGQLRANNVPLQGQPPTIPPINQDASVPNANVSGQLAGGR